MVEAQEDLGGLTGGATMRPKLRGCHEDDHEYYFVNSMQYVRVSHEHLNQALE